MALFAWCLCLIPLQLHALAGPDKHFRIDAEGVAVPEVKAKHVSLVRTAYFPGDAAKRAQKEIDDAKPTTTAAPLVDGNVDGASGGGVEWTTGETMEPNVPTNPGTNDFTLVNPPQELIDGTLVRSKGMPGKSSADKWTWKIDYTPPVSLYVWAWRPTARQQPPSPKAKPTESDASVKDEQKEEQEKEEEDKDKNVEDVETAEEEEGEKKEDKEEKEEAKEAKEEEKVANDGEEREAKEEEQADEAKEEDSQSSLTEKGQEPAGNATDGNRTDSEGMEPASESTDGKGVEPVGNAADGNNTEPEGIASGNGTDGSGTDQEPEAAPEPEKVDEFNAGVDSLLRREGWFTIDSPGFRRSDSIDSKLKVWKKTFFEGSSTSIVGLKGQFVGGIVAQGAAMAPRPVISKILSVSGGGGEWHAPVAGLEDMCTLSPPCEYGRHDGVWRLTNMPNVMLGGMGVMPAVESDSDLWPGQAGEESGEGWSMTIKYAPPVKLFLWFYSKGRNQTQQADGGLYSLLGDPSNDDYQRGWRLEESGPFKAQKDMLGNHAFRLEVFSKQFDGGKEVIIKGLKGRMMGGVAAHAPTIGV